ncbi:unnamed protein product, partial [Prorocentrum cordatum]
FCAFGDVVFGAPPLLLLQPPTPWARATNAAGATTRGAVTAATTRPTSRIATATVTAATVATTAMTAVMVILIAVRGEAAVSPALIGIVAAAVTVTAVAAAVTGLAARRTRTAVDLSSARSRLCASSSSPETRGTPPFLMTRPPVLVNLSSASRASALQLRSSPPSPARRRSSAKRWHLMGARRPRQPAGLPRAVPHRLRYHARSWGGSSQSWVRR